MSESQEAVYFVAIRTRPPLGGVEIRAAMKALDLAGLLPDTPYEHYHEAIAWARDYADLTAEDHERLRGLGLDFDDANKIVTVAAVTPSVASEEG